MKTTESLTITTASYEDLVREMIVRLGEDPSREGLVRTPERVHVKPTISSLRDIAKTPKPCSKARSFTVTYDEMVIVKDIEMFSLCEHHMLPFFGKVHVAYIPNGKVIGLSKIPRLIETVLAPPADPGTPDHANRRDHSESDRAARRRSRHRSAPPLHDDARRRKTAFRRGHFVDARLLP